jgi:hypothetical protein
MICLCENCHLKMHPKKVYIDESVPPPSAEDLSVPDPDDIAVQFAKLRAQLAGQDKPIKTPIQ